MWQNYGHTNDFCVDNTLDVDGNVIEIALKCEMSPSKVLQLSLNDDQESYPSQVGDWSWKWK